MGFGLGQRPQVALANCGMRESARLAGDGLIPITAAHRDQCVVDDLILKHRHNPRLNAAGAALHVNELRRHRVWEYRHPRYFVKRGWSHPPPPPTTSGG